MPAGAWLIVVGALLRAATALPGAPAAALLGLAGLAWGAAFALYAWRMAPLFLAQRADGGSGCEGILTPEGAAH